MIRRAAVVAAAVLLPLMATTTGRAATPPPPSPTSPVTIAPSQFDLANPASRHRFFLTAARGGHAQARIEIINRGGTAASFTLTPLDAVTGPAGGETYVAVAHGAGSWITLPSTSVQVSSNATAVVTASLTVPAGAPAGDHVAAIRFDPRSGDLPEVAAVTVPIQVTVAGPAAAHYSAHGASLSAGPAGGVVAVSVANDGALLSPAALSLTLDGPGGYHRTYAAPECSICSPEAAVLPGESATLRIPWPETLAAGDYRISGGLSWAGGGSSLPVSSAHLDRAALLPGAAAPGSFPVGVVAALGVAAVLLAGGVTALRRRGRPGTPRRGRWNEEILGRLRRL